MDKLPDSLLLQILSQLDDSADVARCRVASNAFNTVFSGLTSIHLRCSSKWYNSSRSSVPNSSTSQPIKPFKVVFLDLISKLETVESVSIALEISIIDRLDRDSRSSYLTIEDFANKWLPRVSGSLKSLSISDRHGPTPRNVLSVISKYCHNLVNLKLEFSWLFMHNMNPMPMLTSLTLENIIMEDKHLKVLNKCFPNLQVLELVFVQGLEDPEIHLVNLKTCVWTAHNVYYKPSLTLITPNLLTLKTKCRTPASLHVEAPMLSHLHLGLRYLHRADSFTIKTLENLRTLWLDSLYIGSLLSDFPITKTVEHLTLESGNKEPKSLLTSKLLLEKVFKVFPNVSSLCIKLRAWLESKASLNPEGWEILDGGKGLKTMCSYLMLVDPSLTFSNVACVLNQCVGLLEVSLLIHTKVADTVSKSFMSKCMARWPGLKWRWGLWSEYMEDSWIKCGSSNLTTQII